MLSVSGLEIVLPQKHFLLYPPPPPHLSDLNDDWSLLKACLVNVELLKTRTTRLRGTYRGPVGDGIA